MRSLLAGLTQSGTTEKHVQQKPGLNSLPESALIFKDGVKQQGLTCRAVRGSIPPTSTIIFSNKLKEKI